MNFTRKISAGVPGLSPLLRGLHVKNQIIKDDQKKKLLLGFENMGTSCEFGLVQRRYGAEPLGLFRWNTVRPKPLIACLNETLAGVGTPEHVDVWRARTGEYMVKDRRWGFQMHTFLFEGEVARDALYVQMCERIAFLKDKFLSDLAAGRKIFVYSWGRLDIAMARRLSEALRAHGPVKLLAVVLVGAPGVPQGVSGDVVQVDDNLCIGLLDRIDDQGPEGFNILYDDWMAMCEKAPTLFAHAVNPSSAKET